MTYKEAKSYLAEANLLLLTNDDIGARNLKERLLKKCENVDVEMYQSLKRISFSPIVQTSSMDLVSKNSRINAANNGIQLLINILNIEVNRKREQTDNIRFRISIVIAVISVLVSVISLCITFI